MSQWTEVSGDQLNEIRNRILHAIDGQGGSWTDDDTKFRFGKRYGTRHHLNGCTINIVEGSLRAWHTTDWLNPQRKISCEAVVAATYVRIEFGTGPDRESSENLRQPLLLDVVLSSAGTKVTFSNNGAGTGSGDGMGRVMNHLSQWLQSQIGQVLASE